MRQLLSSGRIFSADLCPDRRAAAPKCLNFRSRWLGSTVSLPSIPGSTTPATRQMEPIGTRMALIALAHSGHEPDRSGFELGEVDGHASSAEPRRGGRERDNGSLRKTAPCSTPLRGRVSLADQR
jgi:hypothetical protein